MDRILFRIDDFPQGTPNERYNEKSVEILKKFESLEFPYYLGVVPFLVNYKDLQLLKSLRFAKIAMHGFDHAIPDRWRPSSEFDGFSYEELSDRMDKSLEILKDFEIDTFVPPFNMFNQYVLDLLNKHNFKNITGGPETFTQMDASKLNFHNIKLIISKGKYYTSFGNLKTILGYATEIPDNEMATVHLCGDYDI